MEFKLTIDNTELGELLRIFNIQFSGITYSIIEMRDAQVIIDVKAKEDDSELFEVLMEQLTSVIIEENLSCIRKTIKVIYILKNGCCKVLDEFDNSMLELEGYWTEKYKDIIIGIDENTNIVDERICKTI